LQGVDEIGGYVVVVAAGFGYAYAALRGEHTRITVFTARLPASVQRALEVGALALFTLFSGFLSYAMVRLMSRSLTHHTISLGALATPLWIPQLVFLVSLVFLAVVAVVLTVRCAIGMEREGDKQ
jgi:TRAP-type C4-dicarboxylate transport system permease small subunit